MESKFKKSQLCWTCARACGDCSWSDGTFTPVKGWTAKKVVMYEDRAEYNTRTVETYKIKACPLYICDAPQEKPKPKPQIPQIVKRPRRPRTMPNSMKDRVWKLPNLKERIERLDGREKVVAKLAFLYNYNSEDGADVIGYSETVFRKALKKAMIKLEAMT